MIHSREDLSLGARRIVVKIGTSVLSPPDGYFNLSNMASIVESTSKLFHEGKEILLVSSGAAGVGRQLLARQSLLRRSMQDLLSPGLNTDPDKMAPGVPTEIGETSYNSASAAAGQLGLMSLYETMYNQFDITIAQILVTSFDFTSPERRRNVQYVISQLLSKGILPILNENDPVSLSQRNQKTFSDNDSLASLVAREMNASLLILLTDVKGVYNKPPSEPDAFLIDVFDATESKFVAGEKSLQGRGGMGAKVMAAQSAIDGGVQAVVIALGSEYNIINKIMKAEKVGTIFLSRPDIVDNSMLLMNGAASSNNNLMALAAHEQAQAQREEEVDIVKVVKNARKASRALQCMTADKRTQILNAIACALESRTNEILEVNKKDVDAAENSKLSLSLLSRLKLTEEKLKTLAEGIRSIAKQGDPSGKVLETTLLADGLLLEKIRCPIGVLMVIFESRPDCLPQIAALAIRTGNGVILKGGKEAEHSNKLMHSLIEECITACVEDGSCLGLVGLVGTRNDVSRLLKMDGDIDLVIPRGSNDLVKYCKANTTIPVMGHADGVCHAYVDEYADKEKAFRVVVDSKTDYPSACNAIETLLLHSSTIENGLADQILRRLRALGVGVYGGPRAVKEGLTEKEVQDFHYEYGDLQLNVEIVDNVNEAIEHINTHGSGHTETIITENEEAADIFTKAIGSACVFVNASTRFADGFRFGLGAEVGIATGKIHARGPVGMDGLCTYKYVLKSTTSLGSIAKSFSSSGAKTPSGDIEHCVFLHEKL